MADLPGDFGGKTLKLQSPAGAGQLQITWPSPKDREVYEGMLRLHNIANEFIIKHIILTEIKRS